MKKTAFLLAILGVAAMVGCKSEKDIVATSTLGNYTRGQLYDWMEAKRFVKDSILKSKKQQVDKLKMMMIERVAGEEARKIGFDKTAEYKMMADMATEAQLMSLLYQKEIKEKAKFKEPSVRVSQILLGVKDYKIEKNQRIDLKKEELDKEYEKVMVTAQEILKKLKEGAKFEDLAKQYSSDFSKKQGGDIGYIVAGMMPEEFTKAVFGLKEDEHAKEPLRLKNGIYIVKVTARKDLTEDNIERVIENKVQANRMKNSLYRKAANAYIEKLMKAAEVESHLEKSISRNPKDLLFKVGDVVYTVGDLNKRIDLYTGRFHGDRKDMPKITDEQRKSLAENILKFEVLKRVALQKGMDKDPEYIKKVQYKMDDILAREYLKTLGKDITVTQAEMLDEYNKNKETRYYKMNKGGDKKKDRIVEPFAGVKNRIELMLKNKKQSEVVKKWKEDMLAKYEYKVLEKELEGK